MSSIRNRRPTPYFITPLYSSYIYEDIVSPHRRAPIVPHISLTSTSSGSSNSVTGTPLFTPLLSRVSSSPFPETPPPTPLTPVLTTNRNQLQDNRLYFASRSTGYFAPQTHDARHVSSSEANCSPGCLSPTLSPGPSPFTRRQNTLPGILPYLSPPSGQAEVDHPPYNTIMPHPESTAEATSIKDADIFPCDTLRRCRMRHTCGGKRSVKWQHGEQSWLSAKCQVAPTAPARSTDVCDILQPFNTAGDTTSTGKHINTGKKTVQQLIKPRSKISRRWSSAEVRTHLVPLKFTVPKTTPKEYRISRHPSTSIQRHRSITWPQGIPDHEIIRIVRKKLASYKVLARQFETPALITLQRATSTTRKVFGPEAKFVSYGHAQASGSNEATAGEKLAAYLVTQNDFDSITTFLEANLSRLLLLGQIERNELPSVTPRNVSKSSVSGKKSPKITSKGMVIGCGSPAGTALTITEVWTQSRPPEVPERWQLPSSTTLPENETFSTTRDVQESVYEVLWKGRRYTQETEHLTDIEQLSLVDCTSHSTASTPSCPFTHYHESKSKAEAPTNGKTEESSEASTPTHKWSYSHPHCSVGSSAQALPSCDSSNSSQSTIRYHPLRDRAGTKSHCDMLSISASLDDVISFPPSSACEHTIDWWSSLPDIGPSSTESSPSHNLYDIGLDITCSTHRRVTLQPFPPPSIQLFPRTNTFSLMTYRLPSSRTASNTTLRQTIPKPTQPPSRRQSVTKTTHNAPARTGSPGKIGCSIGASMGERRRSSIMPTPLPLLLRRVTTVDNKFRREKRMVKVRPPSVCPPPKTPSPSEWSDRGEWLGGEENDEDESEEADIKKVLRLAREGIHVPGKGREEGRTRSGVSS